MNRSEFDYPELYDGPEGGKRLRQDAEDILSIFSGIGTFLKGVPIYLLGGFFNFYNCYSSRTKF